MTESSAHTGQSDLTGSNTCGTNGDMFGKEGKKKVGDHGAVMKQGVGKGGVASRVCLSVRCASSNLSPSLMLVQWLHGISCPPPLTRHPPERLCMIHLLHKCDCRSIIVTTNNNAEPRTPPCHTLTHAQRPAQRNGVYRHNGHELTTWVLVFLKTLATKTLQHMRSFAENVPKKPHWFGRRAIHWLKHPDIDEILAVA